MFALAAFADCKGVVDFFGAFIEDNRLYIQLELCKGHINVEDVPLLQMQRPAWTAEMVAQVASTLACMHARGAAHLDVKPENILSAIDHDEGRKIVTQKTAADAVNAADASVTAAAGGKGGVVATRTPVYKLGDLGLTQRIGSRQFQVDDGDDRYLSLDLMNGSHHLCAADVFALGVSAYHLVLKLAEPPSGEWKDIRERGVLRSLSERTLPRGNKFRELLEAMVHPDPTMRPSAQQVADRARAYVVECNVSAVSSSESDSIRSRTTGEQANAAELEAKCDALGVELDAARSEKLALQEHMKQMQAHYESQMKALHAQMQQAQAQVESAQTQVQKVQAQARAQAQAYEQAQAAHAKPKKKKDRFGAFRKSAKGGSSLSSAPLMANRRGGAGMSLAKASLSSRLGAALEEDDIGGY